MSEYKEIDEYVSELNDCYDKLYKCFCEGTLCTECVFDEPFENCFLSRLQDLIDELEEKQP